MIRRIEWREWEEEECDHEIVNQRNVTTNCGIRNVIRADNAQTHRQTHGQTHGQMRQHMDVEIET